jgi:hypothetical protein
MKKYCFLFFTICIHSGISGQHAGAKFNSLANASVALNGMWAVQNNQAGLLNLTGISFSVDYKNLYTIKELSIKSGTIAIPLKGNVFALSFNEFGYDLYKEQEFGIAYARKILPKFNAGLRINLQTLMIPEYGKAKAATVEGGFQYLLTKKTVIGTHLFNPNHSQYDNDLSNSIPIRLRSGITHYFSDKVMMCFEVEKESSHKPEIKTGLEYQYLNSLFLRGGFSLREIKSYFGIGIHFKKFTLDVSSSSHPVLGFSPQCSLSCEL